MPPDPVGQHERSRARPPSSGGPSSARALRALRASDAPRQTPARLRRAQRERSRARPPLVPGASTSRARRRGMSTLPRAPTPLHDLARVHGGSRAAAPWPRLSRGIALAPPAAYLHVRRVLRASRTPLQHHPRPTLPLPQRLLPGGAGRPRLRDRGAQGLHLVDRRRRHREDDAAAPLARHGRARDQDGPAPEPHGQLRRDPRAHPARARRAAGRRSQARPPPAPQRVPARAHAGGRQRRAPHRRGPGPAPGRARGAPAPLQPGDGAREDPPDRPRRAARARRHAGRSVAAPAPAAGRAPHPPPAAPPTRGRGLRARARRARGRHGSRALPARPPRAPRDAEPRHPAPGQRALRCRAARHLRGRQARRHAGHRRGRLARPRHRRAGPRHALSTGDSAARVRRDRGPAGVRPRAPRPDTRAVRRDAGGGRRASCRPETARAARAPPLASEVMKFAPAARSGRKPLSVPLAAAVVVAMAVALYLLSIRQHGLPAAPQQTASVPAHAETAAVPEPPPPSAMAALAPDDAAASEGKPAAQRAAADGPLSAAEAAALVEAFRAAYEARDVDRLVELFSDDADENGVRGLDAIAANYRATLPTLSQVRYSMPSLAVKGGGPRAAVLAPFFISYRNAEGVSGEVRGQAEWALERRDGRPRIVALSYRLDPTS